jgi:rubrerythrin
MKASLKKAHDFEKESVELYLDAGEKTGNQLARKLFYSLAKQEVDHILKVFEIGEVLQGESPGQGYEENAAIEKEIKVFFTSHRKSELKKDMSNIEGLESGIELEKKGYRMYEKFMNEAESEAEKKFFRLLMEEETQHLNALENVYNFLTGPGDWFEREESKVWNWMNT